ncbi:DUF1707 SHOCT-like domain-containing protein [Phytoactinopolyspora halophila]|nr:DUF1707 domain-containing protein [Phytoactinopolyspora halophila]
MADGHEPPVPEPAIRVGDADREAAAERLRTAVAEGQLELAELDERLAATYTARTRTELDSIMADLPGVYRSEGRPLTLHTASGSLQKNGYWTVPSQITVKCESGAIKIDFTEAECHHQEVEVSVEVMSGSVTLIVPRGWVVDMDDVSTGSGSVGNKVTERPEPGARVLRVVGHVHSGSFRARYRRRTFRQWLAGHRAP